MMTVGMIWNSRFRMYVRIAWLRSLVQPDRVPVHFELGVVGVALHPRLSHHVERRAGDRVPVHLVGHVLEQLLADRLALAGVHLARVACVIVVDLGIGVARMAPRRG